MINFSTDFDIGFAASDEGEIMAKKIKRIEFYKFQVLNHRTNNLSYIKVFWKFKYYLSLKFYSQIPIQNQTKFLPPRSLSGE